MIELQSVSRWYGQVIGVNDVSGAITAGITALLGPNGAGKSTLIKLVTGQLRPSSGSVRVFERVPFANPAVFRQLGFCPESESLYDEMTGRQYVQFLAKLGGLHGGDLRAAVDQAIDTVGMRDAAERRIGGYSKGMRQRIKVAQAIVHQPRLLVLDEPMNGLDPMARREMGDLLRAYAAEGRAVLISSHVLHEVEQLTDRIMLMYRGRLMASGSISAIRAHLDRIPHTINLILQSRTIPPALLALPGVVSLRVRDSDPLRLEVATSTPDAFYDALSGVVRSGEVPAVEFSSPDNSLEAVFRYLVEAR